MPKPATPGAVAASLRILEATPGNGRRATGRQAGGGRIIETNIDRLIEVFGHLGARWVLVGTHAVGVFTEPRATVDFELVLDVQKLRAVVAELEEDFGDLQAEDLGPALRLGTLAVDLIRSSTHPLFQEALERVQEGRRSDDRADLGRCPPRSGALCCRSLR